MQESTKAALTWVRSYAVELGLDSDFYKDTDVHIHVPAGSIPKDGPSAGVTMVTCLVSALTNVPVRPKVAMTGEITLSGHVLPVGGIKEKGFGRPPRQNRRADPPGPERKERQEESSRSYYRKSRFIT
jgi:ATP-dependent Lon protease